MTDTRTKAELTQELVGLEAELAAALERIDELESSDGLFEGDLRVELSFNAAEQIYRVQIWEWRRSYHSTDRELGWYTFNDFDSPVKGGKVYPARRYGKALNHFSDAVGLRARIRAQHWKTKDIEAGWSRVAVAGQR